MNIRLAHGDPVHLANTLVVPVAKKRDVLGLEAPRLATVQQHREDAALVQPLLEPLGNVPGAEYAIAKSASMYGCLTVPYRTSVMRRVYICPWALSMVLARPRVITGTYMHQGLVSSIFPTHT